MHIIKTQKDWIKYKNLQNGRVLPLEPSHKPESPDNFPVIVVSNLSPNGHKIVINHSFVYQDDAKKLLKS